MKTTMSRKCALGALLLILAGCAEERIASVNEAAKPGAREFAVQLTCTVKLDAEQVLQCLPVTYVSGKGPAGLNRNLIIGSQHQFVRMANGAITVAGDVFSANITVQNLTLQPMGTENGTTPSSSGVRVFFMQPPTNGVTTANHDGSASFTESSPQNYFEYAGSALGADGILKSGEVSSAKNWQFALNGATEFQFKVLISTTVPDPDAYSVHFTRVDAGYAFTCAETADNRIFCWGQNNVGQLGDGTQADRTAPAPVSAPGGVGLSGLATGDNHACAIGSDQKVYCWGWNIYGQLGTGDEVDATIPREVLLPGGLTISRIAGGEHHTCAETSDYVLYCWGRNDNNQLGDGSGVKRNTPVPVSAGALKLGSVVTGSFHTCAISYSGAAPVYCWGYNLHGQTGARQIGIRSTTPAAIYTDSLPAGISFTELGSGLRHHTCGIANTGTTYCWGSNGHGELGFKNQYATARPVLAAPAPEGVTFSKLTGGMGHTCAVGSDDKAYCWGFNGNGNLGFGHDTGEPTPTAVPLPAGTAVTSVAAGYVHSCATTLNGPVYCWGNSGNGQVGDGTRIERWSPVVVAGTR